MTTYPLILIPFVTVTLIVTLATARRPRFARRMAWSALAAVGLLALTAVFDNVMIAVGLFTYPEVHLSGIRVGLAPIEDFAYPLCAAFLVPAVATLLERPER
ncbi:lycopene cyclase domain-containing protein [Microbacterium imperiale]|uniref:Lycopene cyclase n=1 Tax=Microbacterium imperiale TaxID=33884 RepID=A0A9W6M2L8_9MICO|nr:lycopene cyclase domain-containing protein [Microbacterium imperiale]MBP2419726.1 lycopene cyclase domain-containing protein [Microbacterium imperiale]MDS0198410.1 lycopene cyclase domain-containing protein [Microbacterium imperiale]BFE40066.1 lycopene cyclase domain-containing protein [Microbacterium imperiale]GLJ78959.1 lycopene cyclase [Microbacterium imperiale]